MLGNIIIVLAACGFALMGIGAIVKPNVVTQQFGIPQLSVAGRSLSALIDRSLPRVALLYLLIEVVMGAVLFLARNPAS